jgi:hypothetical protein
MMMKGGEECEILEMLPAFSFKSYNGPAVQIQTLNKHGSDKLLWAVNNITRKSSRDV